MWNFKDIQLRLNDEQVEKVFSVILRVPGLFLLDFWFQFSPDPKNLVLQSIDSPEAVTSIILSFFVLQFLLLLLLPLEDLVILYMHYISLILIACTEQFSRHYISIDYENNIHNPISILFPFTSDKTTNIAVPFVQLQHHIFAIAFHVVIANIISFLLNIECNRTKTALAVYVVPVAARLANFPRSYLETLHNIASVVIILFIVYYCLLSLPKLFQYFHKSYRILADIMYERGPLNAAILLWGRSFVMLQFLAFFCVSVCFQFYIYYTSKPNPEDVTPGTTLSNVRWYVLLIYILSDVCMTPVSLASCCVGVSYISWSVLNITKYLAKGTSNIHNGAPLSQAGIVEGFAMALLSFQTGLTHLSMPQKTGVMSFILFIIVGSMVQSMHELVEPILLSLSASHIRVISRHVRVLCVCIFLLVFPLYMTFFIYRLFDTDFWTLIVVVTCVLTSVQVLGALIVYVLFLYDGFWKDCNWESLDDMVYYTRGLTRAFEFLVAVLVVGAGIRESIVLSSEGRPWPWLNCFILGLHCYYNVFLRMQSGWKSFLLRRDAARKIVSFPEASPEQLESRSHDVCAICYAEMRSARVMPCGHIFHASCLKKWLYVQDRCPLCAAKVTVQANENHNSDIIDDLRNG